MALVYEQRIRDEEDREYLLCYSLLMQPTTPGRVYGVAVEKTDAAGTKEADRLLGVSEYEEEARCFLDRLWRGAALPTELPALYDDFIGEREWWKIS